MAINYPYNILLKVSFVVDPSVVHAAHRARMMNSDTSPLIPLCSLSLYYNFRNMNHLFGLLKVLKDKAVPPQTGN
jgi:hypothetical protein